MTLSGHNRRAFAAMHGRGPLYQSGARHL